MGADDVVHQIPVPDFEVISSKDSNHGRSEKSLLPIGDEKEWEEARCPICMDHPHNAVLLLCSSCEKGCRPYMCDTSYRHSNCLDQFLNSVGGGLSVQDVTVARTQSNRVTVEQTLLRPTESAEGQVLKVRCPLCRGQISGWVVIENFRCYMNSKVRNCSLESCNFSGNYIELRKHARSEHPNVKPSDADPERQAEWMRLELGRDFRDTVSLVGSQFESDEFDYEPFVTDYQFDFDIGYDFPLPFLNEYTPFVPYGSIAGAGLAPGELITMDSGPENTSGDERTGDWSRTGSRFSPRMARETGSRRVRNTSSRRTGGRSFAERLVSRRSNSNQVARNTSHGRWHGHDASLFN